MPPNMPNAKKAIMETNRYLFAIEIVYPPPEVNVKVNSKKMSNSGAGGGTRTLMGNPNGV